MHYEKFCYCELLHHLAARRQFLLLATAERQSLQHTILSDTGFSKGKKSTNLLSIMPQHSLTKEESIL
jgi:hypothetical protein